MIQGPAAIYSIPCVACDSRTHRFSPFRPVLFLLCTVPPALSVASRHMPYFCTLTNRFTTRLFSRKTISIKIPERLYRPDKGVNICCSPQTARVTIANDIGGAHGKALAATDSSCNKKDNYRSNCLFCSCIVYDQSVHHALDKEKVSATSVAGTLTGARDGT